MLNGGAGADALAGRGGNDTYVVDNSGDTVVEAAGEGVDRVSSSVDFALGDNIERLTLTGSGAINALGNSLANLIIGNNASNVIDGGAGADDMRGSNGDDYYIIDSASDVIVELASQGSDTVRTSLATYSIASIANVEDLVGDSPFMPTEYELNPPGPVDQELTGNALANLIDGGRGADRMSGGLGDDSYVVDNGGDLTIEAAGEGIDSVRALINWTLAANVENLILIADVDFGIYAANGTGNALDNIIEGNFLNNVLNGGKGADTLRGYTGSDTYVIDNVGDVIVEATDPGTADTDLVKSYISFSLGGQLENLTLLGTDSIAGNGNSKDNVILGNSAGNVLRGAGGDDALKGAGGDDVLKGGVGDDRLTGGAGLDKFIFDSALGSTNVDRILDYNLTDDQIVLDDDIFTAAGPLGALTVDAFRAGTSAQDADDRIIYDSATGRIYYDADGAGGAAQVLFAQVSAGLALNASDFVIGA